MSDFISTLRSTSTAVAKVIKDSKNAKVKTALEIFSSEQIEGFIQLAKNTAEDAANMGLNSINVAFNYDVSCSSVAQQSLETLGFEVQFANAAPTGHKEHWYFTLTW